MLFDLTIFGEKTVIISMSISTTTREKKNESADGGTSVRVQLRISSDGDDRRIFWV